jgi:hypothetical protein
VNERARVRGAVWALTVAALCYSAAHFVQSGVLFPLRQENLAKFEEEMPPLRAHLETGEPVHINNAVQYGPVFFFIVHPLYVWTHNSHQFSNGLYAFQLACMAAGLLLTCATLRPLMDQRSWPLMTAWLVVLWLNFAPLYMTLATKSVETWELALLCAALYGYMREKTWLLAFALACAALVKVLPAIFFFYLLVTNRRAFVFACIALLGLLLVSQALYGPDMGLLYWPKVVRAAAGESFGLRWHENLSLKAAIGKMLGHLEIPYAAGRSGTSVLLSPARLRATILLGDASVVAGLVLLAWSWLRTTARTRDTILFEWSLLTVAMLILSPNTTFEYATLALGAISYAVVRLAANGSASAQRGTWTCLGVAMFLLGVLLPRQLLNAVTFVGALSRWSGYTHLTPSEAYQYFCFPLAGLFLLGIAIWRLRPVATTAALAAT